MLEIELLKNIISIIIKPISPWVHKNHKGLATSISAYKAVVMWTSICFMNFVVDPQKSNNPWKPSTELECSAMHEPPLEAKGICYLKNRLESSQTSPKHKSCNQIHNNISF